jgi:hypothetical protein
MLRGLYLDSFFLYGERRFRMPDTRIHLVLLEVRWRSPTYTISKCCADMYAPLIGMRIPNADDETGRENEGCRTVEEFCETHRWRLRMYALIDLCITWKPHTGMLAHNITNKIWFVRFLAGYDYYF